MIVVVFCDNESSWSFVAAAIDALKMPFVGIDSIHHVFEKMKIAPYISVSHITNTDKGGSIALPVAHSPNLVRLTAL